MKHTMPLLAAVLLLACLRPSWPAEPDPFRDALSLLDESAQESCSICAEEKRKEAFEILNLELEPGRRFEIVPPRRLVRTELCGENELQLVGAELPIPLIFRFHTPDKHLVGIAESDYTDARFDRTCSRARVGSAFRGELTVVPFKYGDGPAYSYFHSPNRLEVHCKVLRLEEIER